VAIESEFLSMMVDTVTVYPQSSTDAYGKRTFSASGTTYNARIQADSRLTRDDQGREVAVIGVVYLYGAPALTTNHRIVLPDGTSPIIVAVDVVGDEAGDHHTVVTLGR
jgi:hypothetical protein